MHPRFLMCNYRLSKMNFKFLTFMYNFIDQYRKTPNIHNGYWVFLRGRSVIIGFPNRTNLISVHTHKGCVQKSKDSPTA